ncbi:MAG: FapA family protein [Desulfobulbaceae bacterium]|nr:FapA family protein [Desulfobulbaceae bacterium]
MPTDPIANIPAPANNDDLSRTTILAGPRRFDDAEQLAAIRRAASPGDAILDLILESIRQEFSVLRIDNTREREAGNVDLMQEIGEIAGAVFARGRRGEEDARGRYEFMVMADNCEQQRKVTIDISLDEIQIRVKGVAAQDGRDGILKEIGEYVKHAKPREVAERETVNHYLTGKFAPAREGEALVMIDNSGVRGMNGIDCLGHHIKPKAGIPCQVKIGKGIRKKLLAPGKFQLLAARTGVAAPVYDKDGTLCAIDVRESVQVKEVGLREGGHVAIKGADGLTSELEVEDTTVDSVGRAFTVRTTGTVNVRETIYGEVVAGNINALMVNAEGKLVAAHDTIKIANAVQTSVLRAPRIIIGKGDALSSMINSTCRSRHTFIATGVRFLGHSMLVLGNDLARHNGTVVCGADLFADRQRIASEQLALQRQMKDLAEEIRQGLMRQVQKQNNAPGTDHRTLLKTIAEGEQAYGLCTVEEEEQLAIRLNNALTDLGVGNTLTFLNLISAKKQLRKKLTAATEQLAAISPPLTIRLRAVNLNDGAQLSIRCWHDVVMLTRIEKEIIVSRELQAKEILRRRIDSFSLDATFDYPTEEIVCQDLF